MMILGLIQQPLMRFSTIAGTASAEDKWESDSGVACQPSERAIISLTWWPEIRYYSLRGGVNTLSVE